LAACYSGLSLIRLGFGRQFTDVLLVGLAVAPTLTHALDKLRGQPFHIDNKVPIDRPILEQNRLVAVGVVLGRVDLLLPDEWLLDIFAFFARCRTTNWPSSKSNCGARLFGKSGRIPSLTQMSSFVTFTTTPSGAPKWNGPLQWWRISATVRSFW
jgi:hypothetical protein